MAASILFVLILALLSTGFIKNHIITKVSRMWLVLIIGTALCMFFWNTQSITSDLWSTDSTFPTSNNKITLPMLVTMFFTLFIEILIIIFDKPTKYIRDEITGEKIIINKQIKCKVCGKKIPYNENGTCPECHKLIMERLEKKKNTNKGNENQQNIEKGIQNETKRINKEDGNQQNIEQDTQDEANRINKENGNQQNIKKSTQIETNRGNKERLEENDDEINDNLFDDLRKCRICRKKALCNGYGICEKCNKKVDEKIEKKKETGEDQDNSNKVLIEIPTPEADKIVEKLVGKYSPNNENDPKLPGIQKITENEENEELSTSKRYCTNCGKEIDQAWKYCNYCGSKLK